MNAATRRGVDGEVTGVVGVAQDVTDYEVEKVRPSTHELSDSDNSMKNFMYLVLLKMSNIFLFGINT